MAKFWRSSEFKKLQSEWEEKLRQSGFEDAEKEVGGDRVLKQRADYAYRSSTTATIEAKEEYFQLLSSWVRIETQFDGESFFQLPLPLPGVDPLELKRNISSDRLIMEMTAAGKNIQEISRELKRRRMEKHNRDTIRYIRRRYEDRWGIRRWTREQMVSRRVRLK